MDTVQVFIPTFNRRKLLEHAIASVLSQTYPEVEIIVLDNASTDDTQAFMADLVTHNCRVRYLRNQENIGMTGNFNLIRRFVSQPFFCVLTDDDTYEPHFLATAMGLFQTYPTIAFSATTAPIRRGDVIVHDMLKSWAEGLHSKGSQVKACSQSRHPLFTHCVFKAHLADEFIFYDEIWSAADGFLLTCLATKYDMAISRVITGYWNIHGNNSTEQQGWDPESYIEALMAFGRLYADFCDKNGLANMLKPYYRRKLRIGLLQVARNKASFDRVISSQDFKNYCGSLECQVIRLLSLIHLLEIALLVKAKLRKVGLLA